MKIIEGLLSKLFSGKYFLTIIGGVAFYYCVVNKLLTSDAIVGLLMYVFMSYFGKKTLTDNEAK